MKRTNFLLRTLLAASLLWVPQLSGPVEAESVAEKAQQKRIEVIRYLRFIRPMVYNFPCDPMPGCIADLEANGGIEEAEGSRVRPYEEIKRIYQEGMVYYFEGNYLNAYSRMLDAQQRTDALLESLSQSYLDRTDQMMRDAIEIKNENDPNDRSVVDISIDYGPNSRRRRDFETDREAPSTERRYDSQEVHWARNKFRIEKNVEMGYHLLGLARQARERALHVDQNLRNEERLNPDQRRARIEFYLASIVLARRAKVNAAFIYQLKYPYDNYALFNHYGFTEAGRTEEAEVPTIEDVRMTWYENPYVLPKRLHPVFDMRLPEQYRRDATDSRAEVYQDEVDLRVRLEFNDVRPESFERVEGNQQQQPAQPAN